ncbi:MAG: OmpA family protein, partial [Bacteroidetes bacterium]|nr:OmpA family protein [Bacteroidota bacterium]
RKKPLIFFSKREAYYNVDDVSVFLLDPVGMPITTGTFDTLLPDLYPEVADTDVFVNHIKKNIEPGKPFVLKNLVFKTNSSSLEKESYEELYMLIEYLMEFPETKITITGYTDNAGSVNYNQKLSEKRAKAVADFLIKNNIRERRITYFGKGVENPIDSNETEEGRMNNRRVEILVLE